MTAAFPYTIERVIGRGGMATVYQARDPKHDRRVAVKVLHPELSAMLGAERFVREINVIAHLQHPHILGLIDSGTFGPDAGELAGRPYYVMPYVEGESLRHRLDRERQLPVPDVVRLATEIASALDYAHRHGVIHRDIKPENILLLDGGALVADFGIALALQQAGSQRMTESGLSLGTPCYMSPEQALGERSITQRSDVYALGAVTYEMLAGEPPYTGPTAHAIVARILSEPPRPLVAQRATVPAHVEAAILRALEKLPADRFATASEFAAALVDRSLSASRPLVAPRTTSWGAAMAAAAAVALALATAVALRPSAEPPAPVRRLSIMLPPNAAWEDDFNSSLALSPDGSTLAYNGLDSNYQRRLYLRRMDRLEPTAISGSETAHFPMFSPDNRWLGFILNSRVTRVRPSGGDLETICDVGGLSLWTWLDDGGVVFADDEGVKRCSPTGDISTLVRSDSTASFNFPHALPGGRAVLVSVRRDLESRLAVLDLEDNSIRPLELFGTDPRYVETGHLVYAASDGVVRAVRFDPRSLETDGDPVVAAESIRIDGQGRALMAVSRNGVIVAAPETAFLRSLELVDRTGRAERLHPELGEFSDPRFSPDGTRLAISVGVDIWRLERDQGILTRVTSDGSAERPAWSPDGRRIAYVRRLGPRNDVRVIDADGGRPPETLLDMQEPEPWHVAFVPDGRSLLVRTVGNPGKRDILLVSLDSARRTTTLLGTRSDEVSPTLSPDGRWLAYASNESGRYEVYLRSFPDMGARVQVSVAGGSEPVWSPRGGELFYRRGPDLVSAELLIERTVRVLKRTVLFSKREYAVGATYQNYDVAPSGDRFAMVRNVGGPSHLAVTLDAFGNLTGGEEERPSSDTQRR